MYQRGAVVFAQRLRGDKPTRKPDLDNASGGIEMSIKRVLYALTSLILLCQQSVVARPLVVYIHETLYVTQKEILAESCDFPIIFKSFSGADLVAKLTLERSRTKADIVLGLEGEQSSNPMIQGIAAEIPPEVQRLVQVPFVWDGSHFLPVSYGYLGFLYDAQKVAPNLENLSQFLRSLPPKSIVMPDPRTSMVGRGALVWLDFEGCNPLSQKVLTYPKGWSGTAAFFQRGRASVMLGYTLCIPKSPSQNVALFNKGGHPLQVMVAVLIDKKNPHKKVVEFLRTALSAPVQQKVIEAFSYPVIALDLPEFFEKGRPKKAFVLHGDREKDARLLRAWMQEGYEKS